MPTAHPVATGWRQLNLVCADWRAAEEMAATRLAPLLRQAQVRAEVNDWWFVRKGPVWRLRLRPGPSAGDGTGDAHGGVVTRIAHELTECGAIQGWAQVVYEPETHAFGGTAAMAVAHDLFSADSRHLLTHLTATHADPRRDDHRRELGLLLGTRLLQAAGQDWYEQGDIWQRLVAHRSGDDRPHPSPEMITSVTRLLTAAGDSTVSPLRAAPAWPAAFEQAGQVLGELARTGRLTRGLRAVLTQHLLFTFNRLGVSAEHQHVLATAASRAVFQEDHLSQQPPHAPHLVPSTTDTVPDGAAAEAERLRVALVDHIRGRGTFRTTQVENAFRTVARHQFLPGVALSDAYAPRPVVTKRAENGTAVSSASSPNLVASMLEILDVAPGHRVLEIGAATGINAALLTELTGPTGHIVTIELDDDLATGAREALTHAGYPQVEVICGDGALGHLAGAPYDRIIVTAGAWDIPAHWWQQLAPDGRLVVPVRLHGSGLTRVLPLVLHEPERMVSTSALVCGFVPMRGADEHPEDVVRLAEEVVLAVDDADVPDQHALTRALAHPAHRHWTGIQIRHDEPAEHLDLWLATSTTSSSFGRLSVSRSARDAGLDPALRWAGAALYDGTTIAYLAARTHDDDSNELGIVAHGPDSDKLTAQLDDLLHTWARQRPDQPTITATPISATVAPQHLAADVVRHHTHLTIAW